ncbi:uncharacterized protein LOC121950570 [Plectropomus leopardus]|uniref:uncharacterized protein LOC121950570 n=1 Tax=Plectropomus leopardus TaxID=160734 RepID=UPI001C4C9D0F|nr:uncharacterized protein LOC121950570 [Plectropomus leopardus]
MRVLWISCLLIGSITCGPVGKKSDANSADMGFVRPSFGNWYSGMGSSDPGSSSSKPSLPNQKFAQAAPSPQEAVSSAGPGSYMAAGGAYGGYANSWDDGYYSPDVSEYGAGYAGYGYESSAPGGSYGNAADAYAADSRSSGSADFYDGGAEDPEPVFSDVSDLEPVFSFSSRSSYQRGRAVFAQTRYTPGEPVPEMMPVYRRISKTSKPSGPAKDPTKKGY